MDSSSLLRENQLSPYQGIEMVAEKGIEPIPSVSETEALPLCNSAFEMASTSRIELLSTVLETVAQPLYHVLMVLVEGFEPPPRRTCS